MIPKYKIGKTNKDIKISPLFEAGKRYNIDKNSEKYQKEDDNGTLTPIMNHCWLTWKREVIDNETNKIYWSREAESFSTLQEAESAKKELIN